MIISYSRILIAQKYKTDQIQVCVFACLNTWAYTYMSGKWLKPLQFPDLIMYGMDRASHNQVSGHFYVISLDKVYY